MIRSLNFYITLGRYFNMPPTDIVDATTDSVESLERSTVTLNKTG